MCLRVRIDSAPPLTHYSRPRAASPGSARPLSSGLPGAQQVAVDAGDIPHVRMDARFTGCLGEVTQCLLRVACDLVPQAQVEVCVKEPNCLLSRRWVAFLDCLENVLRLRLAAVQVVDSHHRHAAILANLEDC